MSRAFERKEGSSEPLTSSTVDMDRRSEAAGGRGSATLDSTLGVYCGVGADVGPRGSPPKGPGLAKGDDSGHSKRGEVSS